MNLMSSVTGPSRHTAVASPLTLLAPTRGWYVGQNLGQAPPQTAYVLDNWFPQLDYVRFRKGSSEHSSGMSGIVEELFDYESGSTVKMFAANAGKIYDCTSSGAVGAAAISGLSTGKTWQYVQFTTSGGSYLRVVNGYDTPLVYDGSSWGTTPTITGAVTPANLGFVWIFKNRMYFVERNTLNAWYLNVDSIGGSATEFTLGGVFAFGGNLLCGASWSTSSGAGLYDVCIFISDRGEIAMYDGAYPGDSAWTLKGLYHVPRPLGANCLLRTGGDIAVVTQDGIVPMSKVESLDQIALANEAVTRPIQPAWHQAVSERVGLSGWSILSWSLEGMVIVNLPQTDAEDRQQFVANARTGAWCRYTGWDAKCFTVSNNSLYFGTSDGRVMQGETGGSDDEAMYSGKILWSWQDLGAGPRRKHATAARLLYLSTANVATRLEILHDYLDTSSAPPSAIADPVSDVARWGTAVWGTDIWPGTATSPSSLHNSWVSVRGAGSVIAPCIQATVQSAAEPDLRVQQMDLLTEAGDILG